MKIYQKYSVLDAALHRIRFLFQEFPNVLVGFSGGKDSTVTLDLALQVATEQNRLPLKVMFIDQEAEWKHNIDYVRQIFKDPRIEPLWFQMPIRISNGTSHTENWLQCWQKGVEWMRQKEFNSIHENTFNTLTFKNLFDNILAKYFPNEPACILGGVRAEESPTRTVALTYDATYKHITYGKKVNPETGHYIFYPIYDWSYKDIWHHIEANKIPYCKIYDLMFQHGYQTKDMRISNLHHETAISHLLFLQEIERDTWDRLCKRLPGVSVIKHLKRESMQVPDELPEAFESWKEYRDYLLENLVSVTKQKDKFRQKFDRMDVVYETMYRKELMYKAQITSILVNDYHLTKLTNWENMPEIVAFRKFVKTGKLPTMKNKYIYG